jgi:hypothetical protein
MLRSSVGAYTARGSCDCQLVGIAEAIDVIGAIVKASRLIVCILFTMKYEGAAIKTVNCDRLRFSFASWGAIYGTRLAAPVSPVGRIRINNRL